MTEARDPAEQVVALVLAARGRVAAGRSMLVAVSGIDGSGKGYVTERAVAGLRARGINAVGINIDGFLSLPSVRFDAYRPAEGFYRQAIRFEELFERLVLPLVRDRSVRVTVDFAAETAVAYRPHTYDFRDVDVVPLEGIYLLRRDLRAHYDLAIWLECSFETALVRALRRGQEGLPPDETIRAYRTIYFPAQLIHLALDAPCEAADAVIDNDPGPTGRSHARTAPTLS